MEVLDCVINKNTAGEMGAFLGRTKRVSLKIRWKTIEWVAND
jgi:hypothetical protein